MIDFIIDHLKEIVVWTMLVLAFLCFAAWSIAEALGRHTDIDEDDFFIPKDYLKDEEEGDII